MSTDTEKRTDMIARVAVANIAVGLVVIVLKYLAYAVSGSVALFSDALESIVNVMTAIAAYVAIRMSAKPPDADHPFGRSNA